MRGHLTNPDHAHQKRYLAYLDSHVRETGSDRLGRVVAVTRAVPTQPVGLRVRLPDGEIVQSDSEHWTIAEPSV